MNSTAAILIILTIFVLYKLYQYIRRVYLPRFPDKFYNEYSRLSIDNVINNCKKNKHVDSKSDNIVFFFSYDYKTMPKYYNTMKNEFIKYCTLHNYTFWEFDHGNDTKKISPYWNRVSDLVTLSNNYNSNTVFVYLDLDTCINSKYFDISIDNFLNSIDDIENKKSDIYIGNDPYHTSNAGVIMVRNTEWSKQFLNLWWSKYNSQDWKFENDTWKCKQNENDCEWGRKGYEQGEFNIIYENNEIDSQNHIKILHYSLISNSNPYKDSFIYHFYGNIKFVHMLHY